MEAAAKALRKDSRSRTMPRLTRVLVIVVPTFAPINMGTAVAIGRPPAQRPTMTAVTVVEDWISAVASSPIMRATRGLEAKEKSASAWPPVAALNPPPTTETAVIRR